MMNVPPSRLPHDCFTVTSHHPRRRQSDVCAHHFYRTVAYWMLSFHEAMTPYWPATRAHGQHAARQATIILYRKSMAAALSFSTSPPLAYRSSTTPRRVSRDATPSKRSIIQCLWPRRHYFPQLYRYYGQGLSYAPVLSFASRVFLCKNFWAHEGATSMTMQQMHLLTLRLR